MYKMFETFINFMLENLKCFVYEFMYLNYMKHKIPSRKQKNKKKVNWIGLLFVSELLYYNALALMSL